VKEGARDGEETTGHLTVTVIKHLVCVIMHSYVIVLLSLACLCTSTTFTEDDDVLLPFGIQASYAPQAGSTDSRAAWYVQMRATYLTRAVGRPIQVGTE